MSGKLSYKLLIVAEARTKQGHPLATFYVTISENRSIAEARTK